MIRNRGRHIRCRLSKYRRVAGDNRWTISNIFTEECAVCVYSPTTRQLFTKISYFFIHFFLLLIIICCYMYLCLHVFSVNVERPVTMNHKFFYSFHSLRFGLRTNERAIFRLYFICTSSANGWIDGKMKSNGIFLCWNAGIVCTEHEHTLRAHTESEWRKKRYQKLVVKLAISVRKNVTKVRKRRSLIRTHALHICQMELQHRLTTYDDLIENATDTQHSRVL